MTGTPLTQAFAFSLTQKEKELLAALAFNRGATMGGLIRKLIREAAATELKSSDMEKKGDPDDSDLTRR
jgi:hypothetical protein